MVPFFFALSILVGEPKTTEEGIRILAGTRTPAKKYLFCLVSGKQKGPRKKKKLKKGANSGEGIRVPAFLSSMLLGEPKTPKKGTLRDLEKPPEVDYKSPWRQPLRLRGL